MKPYANNDELIAGFDQLFPARKEEVKIIVAEVEGIIVFALHLFIEEQYNLRIGHIHDLLINRNSFGQMSDPNKILKDMIESLESFAQLGRCNNLILTAALIDESILKELHYVNSKTKDG